MQSFRKLAADDLSASGVHNKSGLKTGLGCFSGFFSRALRPHFLDVDEKQKES